jgi:hypothetical protein
LIQFGDDVTMNPKTFRPKMPFPQERDNLVRLGTETLCAIGEELRRMYDADLRSKPSERIERLVRLIERGQDERGQDEGGQDERGQDERGHDVP